MRWFACAVLLSCSLYGFAETLFWEELPEINQSIITFYPGYEEVDVSIETEKFVLTPVRWEDYSDYIDLLTNPMVMRNFGIGLPWTPETVTECLSQWIWRWEMGADPYSAFTIRTNDPENPQFVGTIVLDHGLTKGESTLFFAIKGEFCHLENVKNVAAVILHNYAPFLHEMGYYVNLNDPRVPASPLHSIHGLSRPDGFASRVFEWMGMEHVDEEIILGTFLFHYNIPLDALLQPEEYEDYESGAWWDDE